MRISPRVLAAVLPLLCGAAFAQGCSTKDSSEQVALVLCSPAADQAALKAAGMAACQGKKVCNAWIWDNAAKLPAKAPATDKELPKSATGAARAIWIHDGQNLVELRKTR